MKGIALYIFFLIGLRLHSQSVFNRVRADLNPSKNTFTILDSCNLNSFQKDSALYYKAIIAVKQHSIAEARKLVKEIQKTYPDFYEVNYVNGLIHMTEKKYAKAVNDFSAVLQKSPKNLKALFNRSLAFGLMEEYDKAIEDLGTCISLRPMYAQAYYSRGYWYEYLGNFPSAIKDYENAINLDPKGYDAYLGLAYIYQGLKTNEKSCEVINRAIQAGSQIAVDVKDNFCK
jgi:tetratricopeptide (TPR) repeat protein